MSEPDTDNDPTKSLPRPVRVQFGVALIVASGILWFSLFAIPFLPLTLTQKAGLGAVVFAGVQVAWWGGVALAGTGVLKQLTGWYRGSKERRNECEPPDGM